MTPVNDVLFPDKVSVSILVEFVVSAIDASEPEKVEAKLQEKGVNAPGIANALAIAKAKKNLVLAKAAVKEAMNEQKDGATTLKKKAAERLAAKKEPVVQAEAPAAHVEEVAAHVEEAAAHVEEVAAPAAEEVAAAETPAQ